MTPEQTKADILIVDDDQEIRELLTAHLTRAGYHCEGAGDGIEMHDKLRVHNFDLLILDIMLPGDDGFTLCQQLRQTSDIPVIMLTASSDDMDRVLGLEIGADDYIAKPFNPRELLARIKALLRRSRMTNQQPKEIRTVHFGDWQLDRMSRTATHISGQQLELSGADFALLDLFLKHPNQIMDRDTISDVTRGRGTNPLDRSIDVQVSRIRQRLLDNGKQPRLIKTVRGSGYILTCEVKNDY